MCLTCHAADYTPQIVKENPWNDLRAEKMRTSARARISVLQIFTGWPEILRTKNLGSRHKILEIGVDRETGAQFGHFGANLVLDRAVAVLTIGGKSIDHFDDPVCDLAELGLHEPARRASR